MEAKCNRRQVLGVLLAKGKGNNHETREAETCPRVDLDEVVKNFGERECHGWHLLPQKQRGLGALCHQRWVKCHKASGGPNELQIGSNLGVCHILGQ